MMVYLICSKVEALKQLDYRTGRCDDYSYVAVGFTPALQTEGGTESPMKNRSTHFRKNKRLKKDKMIMS